MRMVHIGLVCGSEQKADLFYRDLLGLTKQEPKTIPASIITPLFGVDTPLTAINYTGSDLHVEIFIDDDNAQSGRIAHTCLEVENASELLDRAANLGCTVTRVAKTNGMVLFLDDPDGNRFEIKER